MITIKHVRLIYNTYLVAFTVGTWVSTVLQQQQKVNK